MRGMVEVKVGVQFAIDVREHVPVEFRRHALSIIVGGIEDLRRFHHVGAEQQRVAGIEAGAHHAEHGSGLHGLEIANAGSEIEKQFAAWQSESWPSPRE